MNAHRIYLARIATAPLILGLLLPSAAAAQSARERYASAQQREQQTRQLLAGLDAASPAANRTNAQRQARQVMSAYETIVRRYHGSGYSDNALFNAATLAETLFTTLGQSRDRTSAVHYYKRLISEYPASSLVKRAKPALAALENGATAAAASSQEKAAAPAEAAARPADATRPATPANAWLTSIDRIVTADGVRVTLSFDREVRYREESLAGPARVFFDLKGVEAAPGLSDAVLRYPADAVRQIRVGRHPDNTLRVVLDLEDVRRHTVRVLPNPFRLVIDAEPVVAFATAAAPAAVAPVAVAPAAPALLVSARNRLGFTAAMQPVPRYRVDLPAEPAAARPRDVTQPATPVSLVTPAGPPPINDPVVSATPPAKEAEVPARATATAPTAPPKAPTANGAGGFSIARQLGLGVSRIVIDAGHGGHDPGAMVKGLNEADLTLDIALRLEKLLQDEPGIEVILTRRTNVYVPLEERTAFANREGADLFLSIHANASRNLEARGVETYVLSFASSPDAEIVAARENSGSTRDMRTLPDIVKAITLNNKVDESRDLAGMVQEALVTRLRRSNKNVRNLGVKKAPFVVLIGAEMPSVLAEVSFLTNRQELQLLKTTVYKQRIAEALHAAVMRYRRSLKGHNAIAEH